MPSPDALARWAAAFIWDFKSARLIFLMVDMEAAGRRTGRALAASFGGEIAGAVGGAAADFLWLAMTAEGRLDVGAADLSGPAPAAEA